MRNPPPREVTIKSWDEMAKEYGLDEDGAIKVPMSFPLMMKHICRKTILLPINNRYQDDEGLLWTISAEMVTNEDDFYKHLPRTVDQIARFLRSYCHAEGCDEEDNFLCPKSCRCRRNRGTDKLGLDTALAWSLASLTANELDERAGKAKLLFGFMLAFNTLELHYDDFHYLRILLKQSHKLLREME